MDLLEDLCGCNLGGPQPSLLKLVCILYGLMGNIVKNLANSLKIFENHLPEIIPIIRLVSPKGTLFSVCSNKVTVTYIYNFDSRSLLKTF